MDEISGLLKLRQPFPANQISKLPKPTKAQTDAVKDDYKAGVRCAVCGGWHHPKVVHLDYVGHAALTDRLLDADINWTWEPVAFGPDGCPALDKDGGLWIRLTVCGVTRLGYGSADGKTGGDATKERIGDALRNAAMRFGAALDLWHKGDLHVEDGETKPEVAKTQTKPSSRANPSSDTWESLTVDQKSELMVIVECVRSEFNQKGAEAAAKLWADETATLEATAQVAAWNKLPSDERRAIKTAGSELKERKAA
jgi:hypothetical protein